jgi:glyoxylase-like metal-dependent hydrolase (beta-lactamase superfamily II)
VLLTHGHSDHASGVPAIANAYPDTTFAKYQESGAESTPAAGWRSLSDGEHIPVGQTALVVVHTPGHSPDHVAFWHEESRAVFAGDLVTAGGSVTIDVSGGGSLQQYLRSLERILELDPERLLPAHGPVIDTGDDPSAVVRSHIEHRLTRERQVLAAIEAGHRTVEAIAKSIYDGLDARLMPAARNNVRAHLEKLAAEGIAADRGGWRTL